MKFQRQGTSLVYVDPSKVERTSPKTNRFFTSILIILAGLGMLYLIDGGVGIVSAGIVEIVKWSFRLFK